LQLNELDELQVKAHQSVEVMQAQQNKTFDKKVKKKSLKRVTLS
jgi:hypothetical protein